jgi:hypothetical protein
MGFLCARQMFNVMGSESASECQRFVQSFRLHAHILSTMNICTALQLQNWRCAKGFFNALKFPSTCHRCSGDEKISETANFF